MRVQSVDQRGPLQDDTDPGVAMTMNATLMAFGQAKPAFELEVVSNVFKHAFAHEQARAEAVHDLRHLLVNRIRHVPELSPQAFEHLLPLGARLRFGSEGRGYRRDFLDVATQRFLFVPDGVQTAVDAARESAQLLFCEPPFFSSRLRWSD